MVRAIIFDCFGVLIADALQVLLSDLRLNNPEKADEIRAIVTASNKGQIATEVSRPAVASILGITVDEYVKRLKDGEVKNQQLLDYILELRKTYKIGLLSNVGSSGLASRFSQNELATHFDAVVISGQIGYAKPEPQAYEIIADSLGIRLDSCIMVDDLEPYCEGARAVGMHAVRYTSFEQMKRELNVLL